MRRERWLGARNSVPERSNSQQVMAFLLANLLCVSILLWVTGTWLPNHGEAFGSLGRRIRRWLLLRGQPPLPPAARHGVVARALWVNVRPAAALGHESASKGDRLLIGGVEFRRTVDRLRGFGTSAHHG